MTGKATMNHHSLSRPPLSRIPRGGALLTGLTLVLALCAAAGAGFLGWRMLKAEEAAVLAQAELDARLHALAERSEQTTGQLRESGARLEAQAKVLAALQEERDTLVGRFAGLDRRLEAITRGPTRVDWLLGETVQYVTLAEQRLSLMADIRGGRGLLEAAERVVATMEEPKARELRQALTDDISQLRAAETSQVDIEAVILRLNTLKSLVIALESPKLTFRTAEEDLPEPEALPDTAWGRFWHKVSRFVQGLYRFREHADDTRINVVTQPQFRFYIQQGVVLLLDQAQLATLRGEASNFRLALKEAEARVRAHMRIDAPEGAQVLAELADLQKTSIRQSVPEISTSLEALNAFRAAWEKDRVVREAAVQRLLEQDAKESGRD